jgi:hypothetical protein
VVLLGVRYTLILLLFSCAAWGQDKWEYRIYPDTQKLKVIEYYPASTRCGGFFSINSMAICFNTRGETIRVIEICPGEKKFKHDQIVFFSPDKNIPNDRNPHLPIIYEDGKEKVNPFIEKYKIVTITTYGQLKEK